MFKSKYARVIAGITGTIGAIGAVVGILTTIFGWDIESTTGVVTVMFFGIFAAGYFIDKLVSKINDNISERLDAIERKLAENEEVVKKRDIEQEKAICRLELAYMMSKQPKNRLAIEKKAAHYFCELGGNDWMAFEYSKWADKNDGDITILMCDNEYKEKQ